jgi:hypothetical protein
MWGISWLANNPLALASQECSVSLSEWVSKWISLFVNVGQMCAYTVILWTVHSDHIHKTLHGSEELDAKTLVNVCDLMMTSISQTPHSSRYDRCSLLGLCLSTCRELLQGYLYLSNQLRSQFYGQVLPYIALAQRGRVCVICCFVANENISKKLCFSCHYWFADF